jgi:hypothetical protein
MLNETRVGATVVGEHKESLCDGKVTPDLDCGGSDTSLSM